MNIDFDRFLDEGLSREQIIAALDAAIETREKNKKEKEIEDARYLLIRSLIDYLRVLDPQVVDFTEEQKTKFYNEITETLRPFEKTLLYGTWTPVKRTKEVDADKVIYSFLKKKNLV